MALVKALVARASLSRALVSRQGAAPIPVKALSVRGLPMVLSVLAMALLMGARLLLVKLAGLTQLRVD